MSQGRKANREGEDFVLTLSAILTEVGKFREQPVPVKRDGVKEYLRGFISSPLFAYSGLFAHGVHMGKTIYGRTYRVSLVWRRDWPSPLALIPSTQSTKGSADHKLPYLFENALRCLPVDILLVLGGSELIGDHRKMAYVEEKVAESRQAKRQDQGKPAVARLFRGTDDFRCWVSDGMAIGSQPQLAFA